MMKRFFQWLWAFWGRLHGSDKAYPQTWHLNGWRKPSKAFCERVVGHEISRTESGYAGGEWVTKYCRWCNQSLKIPARESYFAEQWGGLFQGGDYDGDQPA